MGRILEFPSPQAQGLAYLDRELRQLLEQRGADAELIDFAANQLTDIYRQFSAREDYRIQVEIPPGLDDAAALALKEQFAAGLGEIGRQNHAMMVQLVAELVLARVKLFQCERR
jgi:hypothetical protein